MMMQGLSEEADTDEAGQFVKNADGSLDITLRHEGEQPLRFHLHPKQALAFETTATEVLWGGAAGGGKSHMIRVAAIVWCHLMPGFQFYLFRRTRPDLYKNHMEEPSGLPAMIAPWMDSGYAAINMQGGFIRIGKSKIHLCHLQHEKNIYNYQGAEIHALAIDELTHFTQKEYRFIRSRVRLGGMQIAKRYQGQFPRVLCGSNPGGIGHNWVRAAWIDPNPAMKQWTASKQDGGMARQFIPALLEDNPTMTVNDPEYENKLEGLGSKAFVEALRYGNWDIVAGGFFDDIWTTESAKMLVMQAFPIPSSWRIDRSFDWGTGAPFCVCWWAQSDGTKAILADGTARYFPRGTLFLINEWYGWNGQPNEGARLTEPEIARGILEREHLHPLLQARDVKPGPADAMIFDLHPQEINGVKVEMSIAKEHERLGVRWVPSQKGPGSRKIGWSKMRQMLKAGLSQPMEDPGLFVFEECRHFMRTVPVLPRDETDIEDVSDKAEDHEADAVRYRVMEVQLGMAPLTRAFPRSAASYLPKMVGGW